MKKQNITLLLFLVVSPCYSSFKEIQTELTKNSNDLLLEIKQSISQDSRNIRLERTKKSLTDVLSNVTFSEGDNNWCRKLYEGTATAYAYKGKNEIYFCPMFYNNLSLISLSGNKNRSSYIKNVILHESLHILGYSHSRSMYNIHDDILAQIDIENIFTRNLHPKLDPRIDTEQVEAFKIRENELLMSNSKIIFKRQLGHDVSYSRCAVIFLENDIYKYDMNFYISKVQTKRGVIFDFFMTQISNENYEEIFKSRINTIKNEALKDENSIFDEYLKYSLDIMNSVIPVETSTNSYLNIKHININYNQVQNSLKNYDFNLKLLESGTVQLNISGLNGIGHCE